MSHTCFCNTQLGINDSLQNGPRAALPKADRRERRLTTRQRSGLLRVPAEANQWFAKLYPRAPQPKTGKLKGWKPKTVTRLFGAKLQKPSRSNLSRRGVQPGACFLNEKTPPAATGPSSVCFGGSWTRGDGHSTPPWSSIGADSDSNTDCSAVSQL